MAPAKLVAAVVLLVAALLGCVAPGTCQASYGYADVPAAVAPSTATTISAPPPPTAAARPAAGLSVGYYKNTTCPTAEAIVRKAVQDAVLANRGIGAGLVRLFFHDCFVQGCDASVLLDPTQTNPQPEKLGIPNANSLRGFEVIDAAKAALETLKECQGVVSCADIVAFAGRDATALLSDGAIAFFDMPAGRHDGRVSLASETIPNLPPPFADVALLKTMFAAKGFTASEMVTLSGAHTIGVSRCSSFADHLPPNSTDMDAAFAASVKSQCGGNPGNTVAQDAVTPDKVDNQYYRNVVASKALFKSDAALMAAWDTKVEVYLNMMFQGRWEERFKAAMVKMGAIGVKSAADGGEIRKDCRFVN